MLQRDRSGPQIRDKDNNPNQRKHVSKYMWSTVYGFKDGSHGRSFARDRRSCLGWTWGLTEKAENRFLFFTFILVSLLPD